MSAHCSHGECNVALHLYYRMLEDGICADKVTYLCALKACGIVGVQTQANVIHNHIVENQHDADEKVGNTLVDMYAKCDCLEEAVKVFDSLQHKTVVSWTAIIATYVQHGLDATALEHFDEMKRSSVKPDEFTFASILKACIGLKDMDKGKGIHHQITCCGFEAALVIGSALVDMYAKFDSTAEARVVFDKLPTRNVVTWNAMITGYCQHGEILHACELFESMELEGIQRNVASWNALISGYTQEGLGLLALELYQRMQDRGIKPDAVTFLCILKACTSVGALADGRRIQEDIYERGLDSDVTIGNTLIDMYSKCSSLQEALKVLDALPERTVVSWGAILGGLTQHGHYEFAMQCFQDMQEEGVCPVYDTYTSVLTACRYLNRVDEGYYYFKSMSEKHGIKQGIEHFNCIVDLLGRAGRLHDAAEMLYTIPSLPSLQGWMSLLTACKKFGNTMLGHICFDQVLRLDPSVSSGYVLMSNAYADQEMWNDVQKVHQLRVAAGAVKKPGRSWIEVASKVHEFCVRDRSHAYNDKIQAEIKRLRKLVEEQGHVPQLKLVLEPLSDEQKEDILWGHSERLALAFGLISTPPGVTVRITKNLRVCADCHNVMKIVSKVERRQIIIRDALRVHQFTNGICSCMDQCV